MMNKQKQRFSKIFEKIKEKQKNEQGSEFSKRILIVDGLNLFFRSFAAVPTVNSNGEHTGGLYGSLLGLQKAISLLKPMRCIVVFDGRGGSEQRRKIFSEYKRGSKGYRRINHTFDWKNDEDEQKSKEYQIQRFIEYLDNLPITAFSVDGIEADDAIAYLVREVFKNDKTFIMSTDKDYYQLVSERCSIWSPTKKKIYDVSTIIDEFKIHPKNFILYRMLDGDRSDNIDGVKGIGIKTVQKNFPELVENKSITIDEFFEKINNNIEINAYKKIFINKDIAYRNFKLMQLYDSNISAQIKSQILNNVTNTEIPISNPINIRRLFYSDGLYSQIKYFNKWYFTFNNLNSFALGFNKKLIERRIGDKS